MMDHHEEGSLAWASGVLADATQHDVATLRRACTILAQRATDPGLRLEAAELLALLRREAGA